MCLPVRTTSGPSAAMRPSPARTRPRTARRSTGSPGSSRPSAGPRWSSWCGLRSLLVAPWSAAGRDGPASRSHGHRYDRPRVPRGAVPGARPRESASAVRGMIPRLRGLRQGCDGVAARHGGVEPAPSQGRGRDRPGVGGLARSWRPDGARTVSSTRATEPRHHRPGRSTTERAEPKAQDRLPEAAPAEAADPRRHRSRALPTHRSRDQHGGAPRPDRSGGRRPGPDHRQRTVQRRDRRRSSDSPARSSRPPRSGPRAAARRQVRTIDLEPVE